MVDMTRYGMVIDLERCIGCNACTIACKAAHWTPPGVFWGRVLEKEIGTYPSVSRIFLPVLCNHCSDALCVSVCPTGASYRREDGLVLINYNRCIGCRACMQACPYGARFFVQDDRGYLDGAAPGPHELQESASLRGVVTKCDFCAGRMDEGLDPACVEVCPASARYFGDLNDPNSEVARLISKNRGFQLRPEKGTHPSVFYIG